MASKSYASYFDGRMASQMAKGAAPSVPIESAASPYAPSTKRFKGGPGQLLRDASSGLDQAMSDQAGNISAKLASKLMGK